MSFDTVPAVSQYVRDGKPRALAVTGAKRLPEFPDLPTVAEAGVPGYQMTSWYGVFAPMGTPSAIINKLHAEIAKVMQAPEMRERLAAMGVDDTVTRAPEEFAAMVHTDIARYAEVVKKANVRID